MRGTEVLFGGGQSIANFGEVNIKGPGTEGKEDSNKQHANRGRNGGTKKKTKEKREQEKRKNMVI